MVLLKIFPRRYGVDSGIEVQSINVEDDKCYIDHIYNGIDKLRFEVPNSDENYRKYIEEESKVIPSGLCTERKFVVKNIDDHSNFAVVDCEIDLDDWKSNVFIDFRTTNSTISHVLSRIIPTGWTVFYDNNVDTSKRTTVEYQEGEPFRCATAYIIMGYVSEAYNVVFNYNNDIKQLKVIAPTEYENSGEFFVEELNMKEVGFNGDSSNYISRVYAYGKKDENGNYVTIESVNDGKQYVEDLSYTGKIISSSIVDERYTVPENLKGYAEKVLHNNCMPVRSYKCSVVNFNEDMWLYKVVTIIDRVKKLRIEHQCVEYREYKNHSLDEITLSTTEPSIVKKYEEINVNTDIKIDQLRTSFYDELEKFSDLVDNASGLYKTEVEQQGGSTLIYYHDKKSLSDSQIRILISDVGITVTPDGGVTWYGLQVDGQLLARILSVSGIVADWITSGKIQSVNGKVYFDLDGNEIACNKIVCNIPTNNETVSIELVTDSSSGMFSRTAGAAYVKLASHTSNLKGLNFILLNENSTFNPSMNFIWTQNDLAICGRQSNALNHITNSIVFKQSLLEIMGPNIGNRLLFNPPSNSNYATGDVSTTNFVVGNIKATNIDVDNITSQGEKPRVVNMDDFGKRLLYCYEMPSPMFGDIGCSKIDDRGVSIVYFDDMFVKAINSNVEYQVFLQKEGKGDLWVTEKYKDYFIVQGTPNLDFSWEVKAKQFDHASTRLEPFRPYFEETDNESDIIITEYIYDDELGQYISEQEDILYDETT